MRQSGTWVLKLRVVATRSTFPDVVENGQERIKRVLVERYFLLGFKSQVILDSLKISHGIPISLSSLKHRLRDYGLKRCGAQIQDQELREILLCEISGPGQLRGNRAVQENRAISCTNRGVRCNGIHDTKLTGNDINIK